MTVKTLPLEGLQFPDDTVQNTAQTLSGYIMPTPDAIGFFAYTTVLKTNQNQGNRVAYDTIFENPGGGYNTTTNRYVVSTPGYYFVEAAAYFDTSGYGNATYPSIKIAVVGVNPISVFGAIQPPLGAQMANIRSHAILKLEVGDEVYAQVSVGSVLYNLYADKTNTYFRGYMLSEP